MSNMEYDNNNKSEEIKKKGRPRLNLSDEERIERFKKIKLDRTKELYHKKRQEHIKNCNENGMPVKLVGRPPTELKNENKNLTKNQKINLIKKFFMEFDEKEKKQLKNELNIL
jgi:hypothetical protein